jgi:broad specificity phosphatase PhoE
MIALILIRHGETEWNIIGRYQGQADPPLNPRGRQQSAELAEKLTEARLDMLYTSPLRRALETAEIVAERLNIPVYQDARLQEIHQGDWQTRLRSEIEGLYPELFQRWESEPWQVTPPGGEHLCQVQARVYAAVDEILTRHPGKRVGLVAHRIPIALLKMRYQNLDPDVVRSLHLPNTYFEEFNF